jgi:hypothetical protein
MTDPSASLRQEIERPESLASIQRRLGIGAAAALEFQRLAARLREQQAENVLLRGELRASEDHSGITNVVEQMQVQLGKERDAREGAESSLTTLQGALKANRDFTEGVVVVFRNYYAQAITRDAVEQKIAEWLALRKELDALRSSSASGPAAPVKEEMGLSGYVMFPPAQGEEPR